VKYQDLPRGCGKCGKDALRFVAWHHVDDEGRARVTEIGARCDCPRGDAMCDSAAKAGPRPRQLSQLLADLRARPDTLDVIADPTDTEIRTPATLARIDAAQDRSGRRASVEALVSKLAARKRMRWTGAEHDGEWK
jgi:hypothetical protein